MKPKKAARKAKRNAGRRAAGLAESRADARLKQWRAEFDASPEIVQLRAVMAEAQAALEVLWPQTRRVMDEITEMEDAGRAVPDELREELGRLIDAEEPHDVTLIGSRGRLDRLWLKTMHDRTVALVIAHRNGEATA